MRLKGWFTLKKLQRAIPAPVQPVRIDWSHRYLATNTQLKELLARRISPILEAEGYQYDDEYRWIRPWENHSRRVIQVRLLKGAGGEFAWGWCFDFVPVPQNACKGYRFQRTDKSADLQLFSWTRDLLSQKEIDSQEYQFSLFGADLNNVEERLSQVFQRSKLLGDAWFCATQSPELLLAEAMKQSQTKNYHWPAPAYVAAFLLSALGRPEEGLQRLGIWFDREPQISDELKAKLRKQLGKCANVIMDDLGVEK